MNIFLEYMIFILIIGFVHLIAMSTQAISGSQYFYGVYIKNIQLENDTKQQIDRQFKNKLNKAMIGTIIIYLLFNNLLKLNIGLNITACVTIYLSLYYTNLKQMYKEVKSIKEAYLINNKESNIVKATSDIYVDEEFKSNQQKLIKKFKFLFSICVGLSLISILYVMVNYKGMPDTIITHCGAGGKPDGFSDKNIISVFFMNFIDLSMVILFALIGVGSVSVKVYINKENIDTNRKKAIKYLNGIGYSFLLLTLTIQSMTSLIPIFMVQQKNIPIVLVLSGCILPIFISVVMIYFYIMLGSIKSKDKSVYISENDDENWIYGFIYYSKEDPSLLVEKRLGAGWSINMANPIGKFIAVITLVITVGSIAISFIST